MLSDEQIEEYVFNPIIEKIEFYREHYREMAKLDYCSIDKKYLLCEINGMRNGCEEALKVLRESLVKEN